MRILDAFLEILYPPRCIICDNPIDDYGYCKKCEDKVNLFKSKACFNCGADIKLCECKRYIFHFDGLTAPFIDDDYARRAVYDLKFKEKFNCVKTFSQNMAEYASRVFGKENIDIVCCVPLSRRSLLYRGFNQSDLFAKNISRILEKEYAPHLLSKKNMVQTQHKMSTVNDRFNNVRNGFEVKDWIKGKNILLVDDIKTTGASLDECARQLKFAGANKVYCVVALISGKEFKDKSTNDLK